MKSNLSKNVFTLLIASGLLFASAACSRTEKETTTTTNTSTTAESDEAFSNYRTFVEEADRDTAYVYDSQRDWNKELSDRETAYNERWANVEKYSADYDEARRAELESLRTRYNTNWETRRETYTSYGRAGTMRQELLTIKDDATDLSSLTPANIRAAYENFVKTVENNKSNYTNADWQIVEQSWNELDNRKNAIQAQLSDKDKYEIGKAKTKYIAMKTASKTGNTASKVGSNVKDATKSGVENTGEAAGKAGSKVGDAAKKVGSETKDLYKKGEDKVDGTDDRK